jgi:hypothetical protein
MVIFIGGEKAVDQAAFFIFMIVALFSGFHAFFQT